MNEEERQRLMERVNRENHLTWEATSPNNGKAEIVTPPVRLDTESENR